ncbi:Gfo/Idh/MocA family protein [Arcticibacterium luteifluviistationis]|uniref:Oxidoreductase n=1 Tax=Arcticibacterium luteifluviistationis TaxID=1784714 RepID=A0A2Z4GAS2_9BACT|nr:Gfo/Idh/MocA family oxidoreductase [Arcticibacterium luteifluviistationis]AWV98221.1 oxidoreductase [Arcticibacterium luteifluviistationis]
MIKKIIALLLLCVYFKTAVAQKEPMKIAVAGLTHTHVHWVLQRASDGDFDLVGVAEPNKELAERFFKQYNLPLDILFEDIDSMLENTNPEAICAFNTIRGHLEVVEKAAPKGIHVMVEKPLAVNLDHARKMEALAKKHQIQLLTNYETTWYPTNHKIKEILAEEKETFGQIRKMVIHDGHPGPQEIGCNIEFLTWLTDPYYNGAGALTDFGCYGANLSTWLHPNEKPISVTAVTHQFKPHIYPLVDDEATIIVTYPNSQSIIQASWNWNYNRKDMEVYTEKGFLKANTRHELEIMKNEKDGSKEYMLEERAAPFNDPFSYMMAVIRNEAKMSKSDLSSLENNMTVMEILQAAMISAKEGRTVNLTEL